MRTPADPADLDLDLELETQRSRRRRPGTRRWPVVLAALVVGLVGCTDPLTGIDSGSGTGADTGTGDLADGGSGAGEGGSAPAGEGATVIRLADGDSGEFLIDGREVEVRLLGYNAPERYEGDDRSAPGCNGLAATDALQNLLDQATRIEIEGDEIDRFGRLLADLRVDGASVVDRLVADGRGLSIGGGGPTRDLMRQAAADGRGMWGEGCGQPAARGLRVAAVEPNPPGPDEDDLNGEWVDLVNDGDQPIDLDGWDIRDDSSSHRFDLGGTLGPGDTLRIRTGAGSPTGGQWFLDSPSPVWSNRTDTVLVIDPDGVVAAWAFIG